MWPFNQTRMKNRLEGLALQVIAVDGRLAGLRGSVDRLAALQAGSRDTSKADREINAKQMYALERRLNQLCGLAMQKMHDGPSEAAMPRAMLTLTDRETKEPCMVDHAQVTRVTPEGEPNGGASLWSGEQVLAVVSESSSDVVSYIAELIQDSHGPAKVGEPIDDENSDDHQRCEAEAIEFVRGKMGPTTHVLDVEQLTKDLEIVEGNSRTGSDVQLAASRALANIGRALGEQPAEEAGKCK